MMNKEVQETDNQLHDQIKVSFEETNQPYGGWGGCWPGDGSGMDDLADYSQNEGSDW